mmetsp:Transcript_13352/g.19971  ORF Transcript_13352/g.19971 Transcript_13352/m.19971 type:complete len:1184 (-) Transcript_13352:87-3638(-)|eukprot:CAMPEP_0167766926 /NCGR_PEP_ID=MMETSP0110_2-20121227/15693_1 /TAXON_ID=629695 /ORGANISM="Gymnochlora sp., Strain CCMP2014" /LENGTH=1183 /DNA_ID=CAMNT_0007655163 /DNA_START=84 /DNA_END=3635 /DNA_ORIENTATION=-
MEDKFSKRSKKNRKRFSKRSTFSRQKSHPLLKDTPHSFTSSAAIPPPSAMESASSSPKLPAALESAPNMPRVKGKDRKSKGSRKVRRSLMQKSSIGRSGSAGKSIRKLSASPESYVIVKKRHPRVKLDAVARRNRSKTVTTTTSSTSTKMEVADKVATRRVQSLENVRKSRSKVKTLRLPASSRVRTSRSVDRKKNSPPGTKKNKRSSSVGGIKDVARISPSGKRVQTEIDPVLISKYLKQIRMFSKISEDQLEQFTADYQVESYPDKSIIIQQGDPSDAFYIILEGSARVFRYDDEEEKEGKSVDKEGKFPSKKSKEQLGILVIGDHFGERALTHSTPRSASVQAIGSVLCAVFGVESFQGILADSQRMWFRARRRRRVSERDGRAGKKDMGSSDGPSLRARSSGGGSRTGSRFARFSSDSEGMVSPRNVQSVAVSSDTVKSPTKVGDFLASLSEMITGDEDSKEKMPDDLRKEAIFVLKRTKLFQCLSLRAMEIATALMQKRVVEKGDTLVYEGESELRSMYFVQSGSLHLKVKGRFSKKEEVVATRGPGSLLGELAVLHDSPAPETITAETTSILWGVTRDTFRRALQTESEREIKQRIEFLSRINVLKLLDYNGKLNLAKALEKAHFPAGALVTRQGEIGACMYIVVSGNLYASKLISDRNIKKDANEKKKGMPTQVATYGPGDYFGELVLMSEDSGGRRAASVVTKNSVVALRLWKKDAQRLLSETVRTNIIRRNTIHLASTGSHARSKSHAAFKSGKMRSPTKKAEEDSAVTTKAASTSPPFQAKRGFGRSASDKKVSKDRKERKRAPSSPPNWASVGKALGYFASKRGKTMTFGRNMKSRRRGKPGSFMLQELRIGRVIGKGSYGIVCVVKAPDGQKMALKVLPKATIFEEGAQERCIRERRMIGVASGHPFIASLHNAFRDRKAVYLLMELCQGGELFSLLQRYRRGLPRLAARFYAASVVSALEHLHSRNIVYRDLKPENLLFDSKGFLKLVDFGFAKVVLTHTYTLCGTPEYLAPEVLMGVGHNSAADLWSLGCLIFELLASYPPFYHTDTRATYSMILSKAPVFPSCTKFSAESKDLVKGLLQKRPIDRLGSTGKLGILAIKKHPFFKNFDFKKLIARQISPPKLWKPQTSDVVSAVAGSKEKKKRKKLEIPDFNPPKDYDARWEREFMGSF